MTPPTTDPAAERGVRMLLSVGAGPDGGSAHRPVPLALVSQRVARRSRARRARLAVGAAATAVAVLVAVPWGAGHWRGPWSTSPAAGPTPDLSRFVVPSGSMEPTMYEGDTLAVTAVAPGTARPDRGDLVVFHQPSWLPPGPGGQASTRYLVRRVIGLPGDHVACCDGGRMTVNGEPLDEPYLRPGTPPSTVGFDVTVRPGHLWLMGDNRPEAADSRFHGDDDDGQVPVDHVDGVVVRVIPGKRGAAPPLGASAAGVAS